MSRPSNRLRSDQERDLRRTRNEGARRVLRARQVADAERDEGAAGRRRARLGQRVFPVSQLSAFAARVKRLGRPRG